MSSQVFYRKWRPQSLGEMVGQEHVVRTLLNALEKERVSHAYLFCGPRGTGKTTTARALAKAINCLTNGKGDSCNTCAMCVSISEGRALDVIEVDAASNRGIDEIRDLREKVNYAPNQARRKVYIIDEVHMLTKEASNALLKTLEEPPPHVIFILATTEAHKLLPTILSRCQRFDFHRYSLADIVKVLLRVGQGENITAEPEALKLIARAATGSLRDAINLFQQLNTYYGNDIKLEQAQAMLGISGDRRAKELVKHVIEKNVAGGITTINSVNSEGFDLRQFNRDVVDYLRMALLCKSGSGDTLELTADDARELNELAAKTTLPTLLKAIKRFGQLDLSLDTYSTLPLELALVDSTLPEAEARETPPRAHEPDRPVRKTVPPSSPPPAQHRAVSPQGNPSPVPHPLEKKPVESPSPAAVKPATALKPLSEQKTLAEAPPPLTGSPLEQLQYKWSQMIHSAPDGLGKTAAAALLRSARPVSVETDIIVVSVKHQYHKEKMDLLENQKTVDKIVSSFMGRQYKVRCVYEHENNHLVKAALKMGAQAIDAEEK